MRLRCEARNGGQVQKLFPGTGRSQRKESKSQLGLGEGLDPGWDWILLTEGTGGEGEAGNEEIWEWGVEEQANGWRSIENTVGCYWQFNKTIISKFLFSPLYQLVMDSDATTETLKQELLSLYKHKLQCGQTRAGDGLLMPCGIQGISAFPLSHPESIGLWLMMGTSCLQNGCCTFRNFMSAF